MLVTRPKMVYIYLSIRELNLVTFLSESLSSVCGFADLEKRILILEYCNTVYPFRTSKKSNLNVLKVIEFFVQ